MRKTIKIMAVLAVVGAISAPALAQASTPWLTAPTGEGQTYRRPGTPFDPNPVRMPGIANGGGEQRAVCGAGHSPAPQAGPQLTGDDLISPRGGALVNPTGSGPMYSTKQQGDRQIAQLIKTLG